MLNSTVVLALIAMVAGPAVGAAGTGTFTVPYITGHPETHAFSGHPGWVDAYHAGSGEGIHARIGEDARFRLPAPKKEKPLCLIAMFDKIETPPIIVPHYPIEGDRETLIPTEYACVPAGYPDVWDKQYMIRGKDFYQTMIVDCTELYGVSAFDGPKFSWWGNKINVSVHHGDPRGELIMVTEAGEGPSEHISATHSDHELPRIGWRHGGMPVVRGRKYAVRVGAYRHGGSHFRLDAYVRPDAGDGYAQGQVYKDGETLNGDLCCLIFGNSHGQLVENHIRSEEWELFIPRYQPTTTWGQSFVSHGVSLAGVSFWAGTDGGEEPVKCDVAVHPNGPWDRPVGPRKIAVGHKAPQRPIIRYRDQPKQVPGCQAFYELPSDLFQVAYMPDELKLEPDRTYYIEVLASRPIMVYADGDYYAHGYAFYERLKVDREAGAEPMTKHSYRWTLAMNIVTYARPGGKPLKDR